MRRKEKKVRKMRGSHTHGYGAKKKHRGKGSKGGKGFSGKNKHKKTWFIHYRPEEMTHEGHKGFTSKSRNVMESLNVNDVEKLFEDLTKSGKITGNKLNICDYGFGKVLGAGRITKPLIVEALKFSKNAKKKIEDAGGQANVK